MVLLKPFKGTRPFNEDAKNIIAPSTDHLSEENIQNIVDEFEPINNILKENTNLLERIFIKILIIFKEWEIKNMDEDDFDE